MSVELGPGLIGSIYDGIQRPLDAIMEKTGGNLLNRGVEVPSLKREKKWTFVPTANAGDKVVGGDIIGTVQETEVVQQKIMIPRYLVLRLSCGKEKQEEYLRSLVHFFLG